LGGGPLLGAEGAPCARWPAGLPDVGARARAHGVGRATSRRRRRLFPPPRALGPIGRARQYAARRAGAYRRHAIGIAAPETHPATVCKSSRGTAPPHGADWSPRR